MKLQFSEKTIEYERNNDYRKAMKQTFREWKENSTDENLCKALLEYFFIAFKTVMHEEERLEWEEIIKVAYERIEHNRELSFFVGYAMFIGFYLFPVDHWGKGPDAVRFIEDHGKELMEKAYEEEPELTLFRLHHLIYWGGGYEPTEQERKEIRGQFPIPSVVCEYFRRILDSEEDNEENLPLFEDYYCSLVTGVGKVEVETASLEEIYSKYMEKDTWIKWVKEEKSYLCDKVPVPAENDLLENEHGRCEICGKRIDDLSVQHGWYYEPTSESWICEGCFQAFKDILHWNMD